MTIKHIFSETPGCMYSQKQASHYLDVLHSPMWTNETELELTIVYHIGTYLYTYCSAHLVRQLIGMIPATLTYVGFSKAAALLHYRPLPQAHARASVGKAGLIVEVHVIDVE